MLSISAVEAASKSHLGQKIDDHIMLVSDSVETGEGPCENSSFVDKAFFQVFPNGTKSESPFQLSSGRLVITDIEWSVFDLVTDNPLIPSRTLRLSVMVLLSFNPN